VPELSSTDRYVHHTEVIVIRGDSYRLKNHKTNLISNTDRVCDERMLVAQSRTRGSQRPSGALRSSDTTSVSRS
jgi:hypothetical protein